MNSQLNTESRLQPELSFDGVNGYSLQGQNVTLTIGQINNNRPEGNISGSLVIELVGREHNAPTIPMVFASADLSPLFGGFCIQCVEQTVPFMEPQVGQWDLSLELREWCGNGYETIDRVEFMSPYVAASEVPNRTLVINSWVDNVVSVDFTGNNEAELASSAEPEIANEPTSLRLDECPAVEADSEENITNAEVTTPAEAPEESPVEALDKAPLVKQAVAKAPHKAKSGKAKLGKAKVAKPASKPATKAAPKTRATEAFVVSVNHGSVKELTQVKGISERIANIIVDGRPYEQVQDLLALKGIGAKMLAKWDAFLKV